MNSILSRAVIPFALLLIPAWLVYRSNVSALDPTTPSTIPSTTGAPSTANWLPLTTIGSPTARHESTLVAHQGKLYSIGGRRVNPIDVFDPLTNQWTALPAPPLELHHVQAVSWNDYILLIGGMNGPWPNEKPLERVVRFDPRTGEFTFPHPIPADRNRGAAGAAVYDGKVYVVGGITNGHQDGTVCWFDCYDPAPGKWEELADAPTPRDHLQIAVVGDQLFAVGGRRSSYKTNQSFELTTAAVDVYDFKRGQWLPANTAPDLPTLRAGGMTTAWRDWVLVGGGESGAQEIAHHEVEALHVPTMQWSRAANLTTGRHGTGFAILGNRLYTTAGSANRGGGPEQTSIESLELALPDESPARHPNETVTLQFNGPMLSETDATNPFTDYRLLVTFQCNGDSMQVRGFYAADGNAAQSGAVNGSVWACRFSPHLPGLWTYHATLQKGPWIAIESGESSSKPPSESIEITNPRGSFVVAPWPETDDVNADDASDVRNGNVFFRHGRVQASGEKFAHADGKRWRKFGANSPENLLAYADFDGTYRISANAREGEAQAEKPIHTFAPHRADWRPNDPTWRDGRGKGIIGAINYLADAGMNSVYFLSMNIGGDGKDVWPYLDPQSLDRFDCSKLDQWQIVFDHMQRRGIAIHLVTQETENQTLLDGGNTDRFRRLYYHELVARFAHHPGLVWDLGEESGPASFVPVGQSTEQQKQMADYLAQIDPYDHPILIHTHAATDEQEAVIDPLVGHGTIDGLSMQVDRPARVHERFLHWRRKSQGAQRPWLLCMDEIGPASDGVVPDADDPAHDAVRGNVLWGSLMAGGAGVEWYFGYKFDHNDLGAEDWRSRAVIWHQTKIAKELFEQLDEVAWQPHDELVSGIADAYCIAAPGSFYAIYRPSSAGDVELSIDLSNDPNRYQITWLNPRHAEPQRIGSLPTLTGGTILSTGQPPADPQADWLILLRPSPTQ
jgi:hypothetical protein